MWTFALARNFICGDTSSMTATAVNEKIKLFPHDGQSGVLRFAFELARERQLSGEELANLARRMGDFK
jgi:hypothetical protein